MNKRQHAMSTTTAAVMSRDKQKSFKGLGVPYWVMNTNTGTVRPSERAPPRHGNIDRRDDATQK